MIVKDLGIISIVNVVILLGYMYVFNFLTCILTHKGAKIAKNCTQYFFIFLLSLVIVSRTLMLVLHSTVWTGTSALNWGLVGKRLLQSSYILSNALAHICLIIHAKVIKKYLWGHRMSSANYAVEWDTCLGLYSGQWCASHTIGQVNYLCWVSLSCAVKPYVI